MFYAHSYFPRSENYLLLYHFPQLEKIDEESDINILKLFEQLIPQNKQRSEVLPN